MNVCPDAGLTAEHCWCEDCDLIRELNVIHTRLPDVTDPDMQASYQRWAALIEQRLIEHGRLTPATH